MGFLNEVNILGNLGKTPSMSYFPDGTPVLRISLATSEKYTTKKGEIIETTTWHPVQLTGRLAEIVVQYLDKGDQLFVKGKLRHRNYKDNQGVSHASYDILATQIIMVGTKRNKDVAIDTPPEIVPPEDETPPF